MSDATTVRPGDPLRQAFEALAGSGDGVAVVVDDADVVVGTLTDADIRRAVLRGGSLDDQVSSVTSPAPILAPADASEDDLAELLTTHRLPAVPMVDTDGRLVGLRRWGELTPDRPRAVGVLIVGGRGERLRPLTDKMPKPLLRIGPSSIVERLIDSFGRAGVRDIYLTVNYMAEQFEERLGGDPIPGVSLHLVREQEAMDTAGSLSLLPVPDCPLLVSNGDLVTTVDFAAMLDYHRYHQAAITVAGVEYAATVPYGVLRTADHHLLHIDEKPTTRQLVSGGIYVLSPEVLRYVPGDRPFPMPDLIDAALADGLAVTVFPVLERWSDIGSKDEFERVLYEFAVEEES